ncbi:Hypothetical predicted protein [Lynx pardinus]|uniref:Uncharacterized protein n=1 Tax=Lynx pardinus TaxID=191816 RepID=A0A485NEX0_LYNPA|nr:Hypothetical predicted protein [Lynx pardinus]
MEDDDEEITSCAQRIAPSVAPGESERASEHSPPVDPCLSFSFCPQTGIISLYDCIFDKSPGYNQKLHRDDREHAKSLGLHVNEEERQRPVAVLTSSVYGRRIHQPVEPLNRDHGRANLVKADFYRKNDIPGIKSPGFGHVSPA